MQTVIPEANKPQDKCRGLGYAASTVNFSTYLIRLIHDLSVSQSKIGGANDYPLIARR